jgi:hypothetical protein
MNILLFPLAASQFARPFSLNPKRLYRRQQHIPWLHAVLLHPYQSSRVAWGYVCIILTIQRQEVAYYLFLFRSKDKTS